MKLFINIIHKMKLKMMIIIMFIAQYNKLLSKQNCYILKTDLIELIVIKTKKYLPHNIIYLYISYVIIDSNELKNLINDSLIEFQSLTVIFFLLIIYINT